MINLRSYFFIALFLAVCPGVIMPGEMSKSSSSSSSSSEDGTRLLFDGVIRDKMYFALKKAGDKAEPGSLKVDMDAACLTDHAFWKGILPKLAENGAQIDINCGLNACNNQAVKHLEKVSKKWPSLKIHQQPQHGKRLLIEYVNKTGEPKSKVFGGSNNPSHASYQKNHEMAEYTKGNKAYFKQAKKSHDSQYNPGEKENKPLKLVDTPEKNKHIDSNSYDLMDSVVRRIQNTKKGDELYLTSMNFSHPKVISEVEKACNRDVKTDIFVHHTALNSKTADDFENLKEAGANIYVYPEDKEGIFHPKLCLRVKDPNTKREDPTLIIQSRNFSEDTKRATIKDEFNHQAIFPHDHNLSEQVIEYLENFKQNRTLKKLSNSMIQDALLKKEEKNSKSTTSSKKKSKTKAKVGIDASLSSPIHKNKTGKKLNNSSVRKALFKEIEDLKD